MTDEPGWLCLAGSITSLPAGTEGRVVVTGSHGGLFAAALAIRARFRAAIFHDAGIGREGAGIACLEVCARTGMPAATVGHETACIGDARHILSAGRISHANAPAVALGVRPGMPCREAAERLAGARMPQRWEAPPIDEERLVLEGHGRRIVLVDSASLIRAEDEGAVLVTGSHGGLVDGDPARALKADGFAAVFNDAGIGFRDCGVRRLAVLDARGTAGLAVDCATARIGDARSSFEEGRISRVNGTAARLGVVPGQPCREAVLALAAM